MSENQKNRAWKNQKSKHCSSLSTTPSHKEFVPPGKTVNAVYYLGVMKRLLARIRRGRPEYRESGSWRLLHDNAPSHRSTLVTDFLNQKPHSNPQSLAIFI